MYVCIFKEKPAHGTWSIVSLDASTTSELKETWHFQLSGFAKKFVLEITSSLLFPESLTRELSEEQYSPEQYKSLCFE